METKLERTANAQKAIIRQIVRHIADHYNDAGLETATTGRVTKRKKVEQNINQLCLEGMCTLCYATTTSRLESEGCSK